MHAAMFKNCTFLFLFVSSKYLTPISRCRLSLFSVSTSFLLLLIPFFSSLIMSTNSFPPLSKCLFLSSLSSFCFVLLYRNLPFSELVGQGLFSILSYWTPPFSTLSARLLFSAPVAGRPLGEAESSSEDIYSYGALGSLVVCNPFRLGLEEGRVMMRTMRGRLRIRKWMCHNDGVMMTTTEG
jgi:hypothetical protein